MKTNREINRGGGVMTKERVAELDHLLSEAIADCEKLDNLVNGHVLE